MRIYLSRTSSILQVVPETELTAFIKLLVYVGPISPLLSEEDSIKLTEVLPADLINISFSYSNHQTGSIFLVGLTASTEKELIGESPIVGGSHLNNFYDGLANGLHVRKDWYSKLRSEKTKIFFKSFGGKCTCYDHTFDNSDPNCDTCAGTGRVSSYVGSYFQVMVGNDYKKKKVRDPNGKRVVIEALEAWVFKHPYVNDECLLERQNGDVFSIQNVTYKHLGGQLIEESFDLVLLPDSYVFNYELM